MFHPESRRWSWTLEVESVVLTVVLVDLGAADAGATEVTMVSVTAARTAPNHFFAVGVFIMGSS
jgi:hypothetical protein